MTQTLTTIGHLMAFNNELVCCKIEMSNILDGLIITPSYNFFYSKFVLPGSKRIDIRGSEVDGLQISAFLQGDKSIVVVILNR